MRTLVVMVVMSLIGCSSESPTPSCEQAFGHFFAAGCVWTDPTTGASERSSTPQDDRLLSIAVCQHVAIAEPAECRDDLDAWLRCLDASMCDCSAEQLALIDCGG